MTTGFTTTGAAQRFTCLCGILGLSFGSILVPILLAQLPGERGVPPEAQHKRAITVADMIGMTQIGDRAYLNDFKGFKSREVVQFSPDGALFSFVTQRGNLETNTVDFSLFVFSAADALVSAKPEMIVTLASSSNREAISQIKWLSDNESIVFLGESPGELPQVYKINYRTRKLQKLTDHPTEILSFAVSPECDRVVYVARAQAQELITDAMRERGFVVINQDLNDLMAGKSIIGSRDRSEIFIRKVNSKQTMRVTEKLGVIDEISLAPNGKFGLIRTAFVDIPESWKAYENLVFQSAIKAKRDPRTPTQIYRDMLIDTDSGSITPLLDAPMYYDSSQLEFSAWAPDSESIVLVNALLPLDVSDSTERKERQSKAFILEVGVRTKEIVKIAQRDGLGLRRWDRKSNEILLQPLPTKSGGPVAYRKTGKSWREVPAHTFQPDSGDGRTVRLEENLNSPPKLVAWYPREKREVVLMDLNPQFEQFSFGKVELVTWKASDGHRVTGDLYWPSDYVPGHKYPVVIQTHAFTEKRFWVDGPYSTAFAAQPLAGKGFFVLQVGDLDSEEDIRTIGTTEEGPRAMSAYEGAIDYLDGHGFINAAKVGIIGFSRTVGWVEYTLTHSRYKFGAAAVADGNDFGYMEYLAFLRLVSFPEQYEAFNGGPPFGRSLTMWLNNSPGFNFDRVETPLRIESIAFLLLGWEPYASLVRLGKPVEFVYIPNGSHILVKPWERMTSQQGNVDWFCFWLKGEEDPDPGKVSQYTRWRELRRLSVKNESPEPAYK